jgi:Uncharacterized conserved protein (DUF2294).
MYQQDITHIIVQLLKDCTGKGPSLVKVNVSENVIIADIKGALTAIEHTLIKSSTCNMALVKVMREKIMEITTESMSVQLQQLTRMPELRIKSIGVEIDYENDRQILVIICNQSLHE